ncbi:MAG: hypothetical protein AB1896_12705 [Thermodesulfobacteriota bacterium]
MLQAGTICPFSNQKCIRTQCVLWVGDVTRGKCVFLHIATRLDTLAGPKKPSE